MNIPLTILLGTTVSFDHSTYSVSENDTMLRTILVLSNPSSTAITIQVLSSDINTTGKYSYSGISNYNEI